MGLCFGVVTFPSIYWLFFSPPPYVRQDGYKWGYSGEKVLPLAGIKALAFLMESALGIFAVTFLPFSCVRIVEGSFSDSQLEKLGGGGDSSKANPTEV